MHLRDKILLGERLLIETMKDELKNIVQIEHTRHRSIGGFAVNLMAAMAA
jgi:transposase (fragment)